MRPFFFALLFLLSPFLVSGCTSQTTVLPVDPKDTVSSSLTEVADVDGKATTNMVLSETKGLDLRLTPETSEEDPQLKIELEKKLATLDTPRLKVLSPVFDAELPSGKQVDVQVEVENFPLSETTGKALLYTVNGGRPTAVFSSRFSLALGEGKQEIALFLAEKNAGGHYEVVKVKEAFWFLRFFVGKNATKTPFDFSLPRIFLLSPMAGEPYGKDAVFLDYYLFQFQVSPGVSSVRRTLDGVGEELTQWSPQRLTGLSSGTHTLTLTLIGKDGQALLTPGSTVTTTFQVE